MAPTDIELTEPGGIINTKMHFTTDGKLIGLGPEDVLAENLRTTDFKFDGNQLTLLRPGAQPYSIRVSFPDAETMIFLPPNAGQRTFKRISGPNVLVEPKSLQLIKSPSSSVEVRYDNDDYSKRPVVERLRGVWEVIAYRNVPRNQLPPYGFFNDLWTINQSFVVVARRESSATDSVPFSFIDERLSASGIALGGPVGSKIEWKTSFNKWGHLVLDRSDVQLVLKLITKNTDKVPTVPLKIVLLTPAGVK